MVAEYRLFNQGRLNDYGASHASTIGRRAEDAPREFTDLDPLARGKGGICAAMTAMFAKKCFEMMGGQIQGRHLTLGDLNTTCQKRGFLNLEIAQAAMEMRNFNTSLERANFALVICGLRALPNPQSGPSLTDLPPLMRTLQSKNRAVFYMTIGDGAHALGIMVNNYVYFLDANEDLFFYPSFIDFKFKVKERIKDKYDSQFGTQKWELFQVERDS